jgi:hypothetical protein
MLSVILPVRNEGGLIARVLQSLLDQEAADFDLEILAVDGMSTDGSADLVRAAAARDPRVRLLLNEHVKTPFALNRGLRAARGRYVCILGAHNVYPRDYLAVCLRELLTRRAVGCSGRVISRPRDATLGAQLACWAMGHPFGSSGRSFRTQPEGFADTVPYPVMRKDALLALGGYDERLLRNQDNDMNQRLRAAGHRLYCTWKTYCLYHTPGGVGPLLHYAFRNGYWNVVSLAYRPSSMAVRHFIPLLLVLLLLAGGASALAAALAPAAARSWLVGLPVALLGAHLLAGTAASLHVALRERDTRALLLPPIFLAFHLAYGAGSLRAIPPFAADRFAAAPGRAGRPDRPLSTDFHRET